MKIFFNIIIFSAIIHQMNITINGSFKEIKKKVDKKLLKLRRKDNYPFSKDAITQFSKITAHGFFSYDLLEEEQTALSFRLERHIPANIT